MITVYAIVRETWKPEEGYLARFTGDVFSSKKDAIRAAGDMPAGLRVERLRVPDGRIEFTDGVARVNDWNRVLTKDLRFVDWSCHDWVWHFFESMDASFHNGTAEYSFGDLRKCCDWWKFVGANHFDMPKLVIGCPWFMDRPECSGIVMNACDWANLLSYHPEFAGRYTSWADFDGWNWAELLARQPQFARRCAWDKLDGQNWASLLGGQPRFAKFCDWDKLDGADWCQLLQAQSRFAKFCDWDKLDGADWCQLLQAQPRFAKFCAWDKLDGQNWVTLLEAQRQFAKHCNWTRLAKADWCKLLRSHPEYGDKCTCWKVCTGWEAAKLLAASETLGKYVKFDELSGEQIADMLIAAPGLARFVDCSRIKDRVDVMRVCAAHKEFCGKIPGGEEWRCLKGYVWKGASGPVVVIGVDNWIKKFPDYPCDAEERAGRYERRWGVLTYNKHHDASSMAWEDARQVVREIFSKHTRLRHRTLAIDGVYVGDESEGGGACAFALIMKEWLANNESSIKILYLECGYVYDTSALSDAAM